MNLPHPRTQAKDKKRAFRKMLGLASVSFSPACAVAGRACRVAYVPTQAPRRIDENGHPAEGELVNSRQFAYTYVIPTAMSDRRVAACS